jgi:UDP-N-acetylmuramoylalanine--D-glutamate ligase
MKRLVVLGAGESGSGAAILGKKEGYDVLVSDNGPIKDKYKELLNSHGIRWEENGHSIDEILKADEVIKSPGIPPTAPLIKQLVAQGTPILSEIEFAGRYTNAKMICITGSNGKTTTTMLTYHILSQSGLNVGVGGNIGKSFALQVAEDKHDYYVLELSSFQLENMYDFKADVAMVLNITPDHLDRYDHKMENYARAKMRILQNQTNSDYFIYFNDDEVIASQLKDIDVRANRLPFSDKGYNHPGASVVDDNLVISVGNAEWTMLRKDLSLPGRHNLYNSMAAAMAATAIGVPADDIRRSLADFQAVEHRLEYTATIDGARYVNDSKATNVDSTFYALESMTTPTILILGGKDKGNDYSQIEQLVKEKVKAIVCMGVDNSKILTYFDGKVDLYNTHSIQEAVNKCREVASPGDTVLLSPCCASFDLFKSYEDRGEQFKATVKGLK